MTNINDQKTNSDMANSGAKAALSKDIRAKWDKFSEIEVGALKSEDDLVTQLVSKYSLDKTQAQTDAKALVNGRTF
jgi:hypothetical protein